MPASPELIWTAIATVSTALAAIFSAFSAWASSQGARAAEAAVEEARKARKADLAPQLVLNKGFLDFVMDWPHVETLNGEPVFHGRDFKPPYAPVPIIFWLKNFGGRAAVDITVVFELEDGDGALEIPDDYGAVGLSLMNLPSIAGQTAPTLMFADRNTGRAVGVSLDKQSSIYLPNSSPGESREIEIPQSVMCRIMLRGIQHQAARNGPDAYPVQDLSVRIEYSSVYPEKLKTIFRYKILASCRSPDLPLQAFSHVIEMPLRDGSDLRPAV